MQYNRIFMIALAGFAFSSLTARAAAPVQDAKAQEQEYVLTLKDHKFSPQQIEIPAGQKVKITVKNEDATPAEFESSDFDREKIVTANGQASVIVGPLDAGTYGFFDDFHKKTTTGTIVAK